MKIKFFVPAAALFILMSDQAHAVPSEEEAGSSTPYTGSANSSGPGIINSTGLLNGNSSVTLNPNGVDTGNTTDSGDEMSSGDITNNPDQNPVTGKTNSTSLSPESLRALEPSSGSSPQTAPKKNDDYSHLNQ